MSRSLQSQSIDYGLLARTSLRMLWMLTGIVLFGTACAEDQAAPSARNWSEGQVGNVAADIAELAATERVKAEALPEEYRSIEDNFLRFEQKLPGFGGLYVDGNRNWVVYAPGDSSDRAVKAIIAANASIFGIGEEATRDLASTDHIAVVPAQYPFSYLRAWKRSFAQYRAPGDGVAALDADEATNRLTVGVIDSTIVPNVMALAAQEHIPADAIRIEIEGYAASATAPANWRTGIEGAPGKNWLAVPGRSMSYNLQQTVPVKVGGVQIQSGNKICSLGLNYGAWGGISYIPEDMVTASHCGDGPVGIGWTGGDVFQSTATPDTYVGWILSNPAWNVQDYYCGAYNLCTRADALVVRYYSPFDVDWTRTKEVARPSGLTYSTTQALGITISAAVGMTVTRVGRTTGETSGTVNDTCTDVVDTTGTPHIVLCSVKVNAGSNAQGGDSGGPVFQLPGTGGGAVAKLGIVFAQQTGSGAGFYFSPISQIQSWLGITVD